MAGIWIVLGTRPEAIKLFPVVRALRDLSVPTQLCVTGQHKELLEEFLTAEIIRPDFSLDIMKPGQSLAALTGNLVARLGSLFAAEQPERVIVQGDTATAVAAAQAAFLNGVPVAHVEAGLRTGNLARPHPEEGNRRQISVLSDLHFAPTETAAHSLIAEATPAASVYVTGNTAIDALHAAIDKAASRPELLDVVRPILDDAKGKSLILVTCHRRENVGRVPHVIEALRQIARRPDVLVASSLHANPSVRDPVIAALGSVANVVLLNTLGWVPFVKLLSSAHLVLTDSGGVQEEAPTLGTPVLIMRDMTERPEGIEAGTALLVGTDPDTIFTQTCRQIDNPLVHARMARKHNPYGDGQAAHRIAAVIAATHGYCSPSERLAV